MTPTLPSFRSWLDDRCAVAEREERGRTFLEFRNRKWSYADLARITDAIAAALHARGVAPGDRVALALGNSPEHIFAWLAAAKLGATVAPLHSQWTPAEVDRALAQLRPRLIVGELQPLWPGIEDETEAGKTVSLVSSSSPFSPVSFLSMEAPDPLGSLPSPTSLRLGRDEIARLVAAGSDRFPSLSETLAEAPAELLFTSGTTGLPKAAVQSFRSMMLTGEAFADWLRLGPGDRLFTCLPLAHINARFYSTMGALAAGATLVLEERFSASAFWRWMAESGATVVNTIGAMLRILLLAPASDLERAHRLRIVYTSPALGEVLHRQFETRFGVRLVVGYGMTECTFGFIHPVDLPLDSPARHLDSMGRPRRHPDLSWPAGWRLVDPANGLELAPPGEPGSRIAPVPAGPTSSNQAQEPIAASGQTPERPVESDPSGEIWLSGPTLFSGYFENPEATASVLRPDGWLQTGDLAERDPEGWWTFVGRTKEMIRRRGENISPLEIETLLMSHPAVAEAAVIGVPSALGEEEIAAFVVGRSGMPLDAPTLRDFCAAHLAKFKVPSEWRFLESLPRTSTNRVAKAELRALHSGPPST